MSLHRFASSSPHLPRTPAVGPTFEDLTFDDSLDDMARIARYSTSAIALQRLVHVKMISTTAHAFGCVAARATGSAPSMTPRFVQAVSSQNPPDVPHRSVASLPAHARHCACRYERTRESIFPLLPTLAADVEVVLRQHLAEQLRSLAEVRG